MWSSGNCQSESHTDEGATILLQRKRTVDLVRQAQVAACSYLGFDPHDEKNNHSIKPQMSASDLSGPMELHLHHHHHHHYTESPEVNKPSHISTGMDVPSRLGTTFSIGNQNPMHQDAWQGHGKFDEPSQKTIPNGPWMRNRFYQGQDRGYLDIETRSSSQSDYRERKFFCAEGGWSIHQPGISQQPAPDNQQHHAAARFSHASYSTGHWECGVIQGEGLGKGSNFEVEQTTEKRTSWPITTEESDLMATDNFGWGPTAKYSSSSHFTPTRSSSKSCTHVAQYANETFVTNGTQDLPTNSARKFGTIVTKRKKFTEDVSHEIPPSSSDLLAHLSPPGSGKCNHAMHLEKPCEYVSSLATTPCREIAQPFKRNSTIQGHDLLAPENGVRGVKMISVHVEKAVSGRCQQGNSSISSCKECNCQESTPIQTAAKRQAKQKGLRLQMTFDLIKEKDNVDLHHHKVKQEILKEKIITLDVVDERSRKSLSRVDVTTEESKTLGRKQDQTAYAGVKETLTVNSIQAATDHAGLVVNGSAHAHACMKVEQEQTNTHLGGQKQLDMNPKLVAGSSKDRKENLLEGPEGIQSTKNEEVEISRACNDVKAQRESLQHRYKAQEQSRNTQDVGVQIQILDKCTKDIAEVLNLDIVEGSKSKPPHQKPIGMKEMVQEWRQDDPGLLSSVNFLQFMDQRKFLKPTTSTVSEHCTANLKVSLQEGGKTQTLNNGAECEERDGDAFSQSHTGILRLQQQLELEKYRHESSKKELEEVKKNIEEFLRELGANKVMQHLNFERDSLSKTLSKLQEKERKKVITEIEARLAAEEKLRNFEAPAEATEGRLLRLFDERAKIHLKLEDTIEQKDADKINLKILLDKEKLKYEATENELLELKEKLVFLLNKSQIRTLQCEGESQRIELSSNSLSDTFESINDGVDKHEANRKGQEKVEVLGLREATSNQGSESSEAPGFLDNMNSCQMQRSIVLKDKETELLKLVKQQEFQLKTAEDALKEMEKRMKNLEIDKGTLQKALKVGQSDKEFKGVEKAIQTICCDGGFFETYNHIYQSPIFEHWKMSEAEYEESISEERSQQFSEDRVFLGGEQRCNKPKEEEKGLAIHGRDFSEELKILRGNMLKYFKGCNRDCSHTEKLLSAAIDESKSLQMSLDIARRQIAEEESTNQMLRKNLQEKGDYLTDILARHAKEIERTENTSNQAYQVNLKLANDLTNTETRLSELQVHYDGLLGTVENQLQEARKDAEDLQETADALRNKLAKSEAKALEFKKSAEKKDQQLRELKRSMQALNIEKDAVAKEKSELLLKLQEATKEADNQKFRVAEYLSINEELIDFAQQKENEVNDLNQNILSLQQQVVEKTNESTKTRTELEETRKLLTDLKKDNCSIRSEHEYLMSKIAESDQQLLQREATIAQLNKQMADVINGHDSMLEEAAQFHEYLQNAKYQEFHLENDLRQSKTNVKDLEDKLCNMEAEILKTRLELAEFKRQNSLLHKLAEEKENEAVEMAKELEEQRKKIQDLEEEVMEKEGQIAILRSSFPDEFESSF